MKRFLYLIIISSLCFSSVPSWAQGTFKKLSSTQPTKTSVAPKPTTTTSQAVTNLPKSSLPVPNVAMGIQANENDSLALVALYNATDGLNWFNNVDWLTGSLETWYGVSVDENGRVDSLNLSLNGLANSLPDSLYLLTELLYLDLSFNYFNGIASISPAIGSLTKLQTLNVSQSGFAGSIPVEINNLTNLISAELSYNSFTSIPIFTSSAATFAIEGNRLTFADLEKQIIPPSNISSPFQNAISKDTTIYTSDDQTIILDATTPGTSNSYIWYYNDFVNIIPIDNTPTITLPIPLQPGAYYCEIQNSPVSDNYGLTLTSGTAYVEVLNPINTKDRTALEQIYNENNGDKWGANWKDINGNFTEFPQLWNGVTVENNRVTELNFYYSPINGKPSNAFGKLDSLITLNLYGCGITELPDTLSALTKLQNFACTENQLVDFPQMLSSLPDLIRIELNGNEITLPATVTGFSQLQYLNLNYNNLTEFPNIFSNLTNLNELNLRDNNIALLPEEFSGFLSLSSLDLSRNQLSSISPGIGSLGMLQNLQLENNNIEILPDTSQLSNFAFVDINNNNLDFEDLEPYAGLTNVLFGSQKKISSGGLISKEEGDIFNTTISVGGTANQYQWYENGSLITDQITNTLEISVNQPATYYCEISSSLVPSLILKSGIYKVYVPKDTLITSPALFYSYKNEYSTGVDEFVEENGFAVSNVAGSGFGKLISVISPAYWDIDPVKNLIYFMPSDELNDDDIAPIILSYSFLDGVIDTVYNHINQTGLAFVTVDYTNDFVYFMEEQDEVNAQIMRLNLNSPAPPEVFINDVLYDNGSGQSNDNGPAISMDLDLITQRIYWHQASNTGALSTVMRKNLDGSGVTEIVLQDKPIHGEIMVDSENDFIFTLNIVENPNTESFDYSIVSYNLEGEIATIYQLGEDFQGSFAIRPNSQEIYYMTRDNQTYNTNQLYSTTYTENTPIKLIDLPVQDIHQLLLFDEPQVVGNLQTINPTDSAALVTIYDKLGGDNWSTNNGWKTAEGENWYGVTLDANKRVVALELPENNLVGKLSQQLFDSLTSLKTINLEGNKLTGGLASEFFFKLSLDVLKLGNNQLGGTIAALS